MTDDLVKRFITEFVEAGNAHPDATVKVTMDEVLRPNAHIVEHAFRAALEAAAPMIRAAALEEAAKVADDAKRSWHNKVKELESEYLDLARERYAVSAATEIAAAIRAMKGNSDDQR